MGYGDLEVRIITVGGLIFCLGRRVDCRGSGEAKKGSNYSLNEEF